MSHLITEALQKAYGYALAKSPTAIEPADAFCRAVRIVGNVEGAGNAVRSMNATDFSFLSRESFTPSGGRSLEISEWLDDDDNPAKVEAVALALIEGRLSAQSDAKLLDEILRSPVESQA